MNGTTAVHQAASLLLYYPGDGWPGLLGLVREQLGTVRGPAARPLVRFCDRMADTPVLDAAAHYTDVFDRTPRRTLHLTYYTDGDTRRRGAALARLKALYQQHGWQPAPDELPDHLALMLEFAARCPRPGRRLLHDHRAAVELLRTALDARGTPYALVLESLSATLPGPRPANRAAARRLARTPPPVERVGVGDDAPPMERGGGGGASPTELTDQEEPRPIERVRPEGASPTEQVNRGGPSETRPGDLPASVSSSSRSASSPSRRDARPAEGAPR
ncbi:nitrate reductase molybdenum cofactor assembly chaperone [Streptomyces sp. NPDC003077]|uniref:nitrate reductase molybdenum cofactor assembly chaperone n=1 Tax=Streptomyces sp. NPDC003077 TaxID=3154443 RepID=UPI0033A4D43D